MANYVVMYQDRQTRREMGMVDGRLVDAAVAVAEASKLNVEGEHLQIPGVNEAIGYRRDETVEFPARIPWGRTS